MYGVKIGRQNTVLQSKLFVRVCLRYTDMLLNSLIELTLARIRPISKRGRTGGGGVDATPRV